MKYVHVLWSMHDHEITLNTEKTTTISSFIVVTLVNLVRPARFEHLENTPAETPAATADSLRRKFLHHTFPAESLPG